MQTILHFEKTRDTILEELSMKIGVDIEIIHQVLSRLKNDELKEISDEKIVNILNRTCLPKKLIEVAFKVRELEIEFFKKEVL